MVFKKNVLINVILISFSLIVMIIGGLSSSLITQLLGLNIIWFSNVVYSINDIKNNILFLFFNIVFHVFLMGRMNIVAFMGFRRDERGIFGLNFNEPEIISQIIILLYISLLFLYLGYRFFNNIRFEVPLNNLLVKISTLRKASLVLFIIAIFIRLYMVFEMRNASVSEGYFEIYLSFNSSLPDSIAKFGSFYSFFFLAFLATHPTKKMTNILTLLYLFEGGIAALSGSRSVFLQNLLLIIVYYTVRSIEEPKWVGFKEISTTLLGAPIILASMSFIGRIRGNFSNIINYVGIIDSIKDFFYTQGISTNVIGFSEIYKDLLPRKGFYTLGPIFEFILNFLRSVKGLPIFSGQSIERATEGYQLSHTITFLNSPNAYLRGQGYGSSFIAENYADIGIIGVILGSFIYGIVISLLLRIVRSRNFIATTFSLVMIRGVFMVPRAAFLKPIVDAFTPDNFIALFIIYLVSLSITSFKKIKI